MALSRWRAAHPWDLSYQSAPAAIGGVAVDAYVARTYVVLFSALLSIAALGLVSYLFVPRSWTIGLALADAAIWVLCGWFGWRRPLALTFPLFAVITGVLLGQLAYLDTRIFLSATVLALTAFGGLCLFVHVTGRNFSFLRGFLFVAFFVLLGGWILSAFVRQPVPHLAWTAFGVIVFGCWILFDTSRIIHRDDAGPPPGVAAFELLLDIVGLHRWLLDLMLGDTDDDRRPAYGDDTDSHAGDDADFDM